MVRHFLGTLFFSFIFVVIFVNLFQFSGATPPFEVYGSVVDDVPVQFRGIFGFTSIFTFVEEIGTNKNIALALDWFNWGVKLVQKYSIDQFSSLYSDMRDVDINNVALVISLLINSVTNIMFYGLVLPIVFITGAFMIFLSIVMFLWEIIGILVLFLLGKYNYYPVHSCLLTSEGCLSESASYLVTTVPVIL